ncbi:MAG: hypothetical protein JXA54_14490 [Candidatus Heimdallarchaeota archaeon]|nr:hypothetical protein [Candidatus Heimdallarchaeota archaeon]
MQGNPVAYRNLYRHLQEILNYLEISLDSDFVLEELSEALYECERTFGQKHQFVGQIKNQLNYLYNKYIEKKALPLENNDAKKLEEKIQDWLKKYYKKQPI